MPPGGGGAKPTTGNFWLCHGLNGTPCGYMVPRGKAWCDACGNQPPAHVSAPRGNTPAQPPQPAGETGRGKGAQRAPGAMPGPTPRPPTAAPPGAPTDASTPRRRARGGKKGEAGAPGASAANDAGSANKLAKENADLRKQLAALRAAAAGDPAQTDAPMDEGGPADADDDALAQALRDAEAALAAVKDVGGAVGAEFRATAQAKVDAARAAYRASWDLPRQLRRAERCRAGADRKAARAVALRDEADAARREAQARYDEAVAAADAALASAAAAAADVAALAAQMPRTGDPQPAPTAPLAREAGVGEALALLSSLVDSADDATLAALAAVRAALGLASTGGPAARRPTSRTALAARGRDDPGPSPHTGRRSRSRDHVPPGAEAAYADLVATGAAERGDGEGDKGGSARTA